MPCCLRTSAEPCSGIPSVIRRLQKNSRLPRNCSAPNTCSRSVQMKSLPLQIQNPRRGRGAENSQRMLIGWLSWALSSDPEISRVGSPGETCGSSGSRRDPPNPSSAVGSNSCSATGAAVTDPHRSSVPSSPRLAPTKSWGRWQFSTASTDRRNKPAWKRPSSEGLLRKEEKGGLWWRDAGTLVPEDGRVMDPLIPLTRMDCGRQVHRMGFEIHRGQEEGFVDIRRQPTSRDHGQSGHVLIWRSHEAHPIGMDLGRVV